MDQAQRADWLAAAGFNVLNLHPAHIAIDLTDDVPRVPLIDSVRSAARSAADTAACQDLTGLAEQLYGPAQYFVTANGRSAELALAGGLRRRGITIITPSLFATTRRAFALAGAVIEVAPRSSHGHQHGSSDLDLDWLAERLDRGGVDLVHLEAASNELAGWPLQLDRTAATAELCRRSGALLYIDACRILANAAALANDPVRQAKAILRHADVFTVGAGKELLCPVGGLIGVRSGATQLFDLGQLATHIRMGGAALPEWTQSVLAAGMTAALEEPRWLIARQRQLGSLASRLGDYGVETVRPTGCHAVYVVVDAALEPVLGPERPSPDPLRNRSLDALLYRLTGIRGSMIRAYPLLRQTLLRLPLTIAKYDDVQIAAIAAGVHEFLQRAGEAPVLYERAPYCADDYWRHFDQRSS